MHPVFLVERIQLPKDTTFIWFRMKVTGWGLRCQGDRAPAFHRPQSPRLRRPLPPPEPPSLGSKRFLRGPPPPRPQPPRPRRPLPPPEPPSLGSRWFLRASPRPQLGPPISPFPGSL